MQSEPRLKGQAGRMSKPVEPAQRRRRPLIAGALLVAAVLFNCSIGYAGETIDVEGNRRIDADTVRSYFHPSPDGHYDAAALDDALKALVATNLFDNVTVCLLYTSPSPRDRQKSRMP